MCIHPPIHPSKEKGSALHQECISIEGEELDYIHPSIDWLFMKNVHPSKRKGSWVCIDLHSEARWRRLIG
jgi:hypothetical protein